MTEGGEMEAGRRMTEAGKGEGSVREEGRGEREGGREERERGRQREVRYREGREGEGGIGPRISTQAGQGMYSQ